MSVVEGEKGEDVMEEVGEDVMEKEDVVEKEGMFEEEGVKEKEEPPLCEECTRRCDGWDGHGKHEGHRGKHRGSKPTPKRVKRKREDAGEVAPSIQVMSHYEEGGHIHYVVKETKSIMDTKMTEEYRKALVVYMRKFINK